MFHFWFQCFSGVSPIGVWFLSHWGFKSLPLGFYFSPTEFLERGVVNKKWNIETKNETLKPKMKHWNLKWNIERQCFISWSVWFSMSWNIKMKHEIFFTIVYNTYTRARRGKFAKKENRQNSVIKKKKWLLFPYMDFLGLFCRYIKIVSHPTLWRKNRWMLLTRRWNMR